MITIENDHILEEDLRNSASAWKSFNNQTFFVTGATGLVGSMLVKSILYANDLYHCGNHVIAAVRSVNKTELVFGKFTERIDFSYQILSLEQSIQVEDDIDYVIHCASPTTSKYFISNPVETIKTLVIGTSNMLQFAFNKQVKAFLYISSMEIYGNVQCQERTEESQLGNIDILNIRSCYSEGKRMCECLCASYYSEYHVPIRIARLAQTFGAGVAESDNRVFAQFSKCMLNQEDIVLHTDGTSYGNYCYTSDAVSGIACILDKGKNGEAYNIVNESTTMQIREMAQLICEKLANNKIKVVFDIPEDSLKYGYAPPTKLKLSGQKLINLGWKPIYNLEEMYQRTIDSYKARNIH